MTTTTVHERPNVEEMAVVHRVFRREFGAAPGLVRGVAASDVRRAGVVADHLDLVLAGLHMHHTGEDEVLWPRLLERAAPSTGLVETMQAQHERVDALADQVTPLLAAWRARADSLAGEQLARVLEDFTDALLEHLEREEREVVPLIARHITPAEWDSLGEHGRDAMSPRQLPLLFGSLLEEATAEERRMLLAPLPVLVRWLLLTLGARVYRRRIRQVRQG